ncbi:MAG TPA: hypothetical protein DCF33_08310, partial [Saprospirales bacterium]|nr:hypothetical protein [Saprospirales bacterium]
DADGDGYGNANVSQQACSAPQGYVTNSTDCDDSQASVNPGAQEACGNGVDDDCDGNVDEDCCNSPCFDAAVLNAGTDYYYYLNTEITDCGGWNNLAYVYCQQFEAYAWSFDPSYQVIAFYSFLDNSSCVAFVGEGEGYVSQAEFDCTMALLRSFIAAHPEIPNGCNPYNGNDPNARVIPENLKKLLPENLRNSLQKQ